MRLALNDAVESETAVTGVHVEHRRRSWGISAAHLDFEHVWAAEDNRARERCEPSQPPSLTSPAVQHIVASEAVLPAVVEAGRTQVGARIGDVRAPVKQ